MIKPYRILIAAAFLLAAPAVALAARGYATAEANMYAGPGRDYPVVDHVPTGAHVDIHGCLSDDSWCDVSWQGDRGWVSADALNYFYNGRYVYLPDYEDVIDVPVVTFSLGSYWNDYYVGRPWYHRRAHWERFWRSHRHHFARRHRRHEHIVHERNRQHFAHEHPHRLAHGNRFEARHRAQHFVRHRAAPNRRRLVVNPRQHRFGNRHALRQFGRQHFAGHRAAPRLRGFNRGALHAHASVGRGAIGIRHGAAPHFNGAARGRRR